jgi:hypothetical protein
VNPESRLAEIMKALETVGLTCLIMGGHAARFYGVDRKTADYDLHLAPECWRDLPAKLKDSSLSAGTIPVEGPTWRPNAFRRFQIGTLPSGREEWLEFWHDNHLLAPFAELYSRREQGLYGGRPLPFLSLPDLIRSKETERESDWQDILLLEEFHDARLLAKAKIGIDALILAISQVRSRRGFESLLQQGLLNDPAMVQQALTLANHPLTQAYLLPCAKLASPPAGTISIEPAVVNRLLTELPGSPLHLALVEVVRRNYKLRAQAADRADKERVRMAREKL